jgi:hypothetical protein
MNIVRYCNILFITRYYFRAAIIVGSVFTNRINKDTGDVNIVLYTFVMWTR